MTNVHNASIGQNGPAVKIEVAINVHNDEARVTAVDISKTGIKSSSNPGRRTVPRVTTPPVVDLTGQEPRPALICNGRNANPRAASPPFIDLTIDEDEPERPGLVSNGRTDTSTDSSSEETPTVVDLTQEEEEDIVPEEDILECHVTPEEWEQSGFDRD